jgi:phytoene/squalene synthetase
MEQVQRFDPDRYMCSLFFPESLRYDLYALFAFNHELASLSELVSEPMIGMIRLAWWKEAIEEIYVGKKPREHPAIAALADVIKKHSIPQSYFYGLIQARERDFSQEPFATTLEFERYLDQTSSQLLLVVAHILGARDHTAHEGVGVIGRAWAISGIVRALPYFINNKRCMLPLDILEKHGLTAETFLNTQMTDTVKLSIMELLSKPLWELRNNFDLSLFSPEIKKMRVFYHHAKLWLERIERLEGDFQHPALKAGRFMMLLRLWWAMKK